MGASQTHWAIETMQEDGERLVLKIIPDKGWYELTPQSESSFYHLSAHDDFTITFVLDESGEATQFLYETRAGSYTFLRAGAEPEPATVAPTQSTTPTGTPLPPTSTPVPPTAAPTLLATPTATSVPPTATLIPPTAAPPQVAIGTLVAMPTATAAPPTVAPTSRAAELGQTRRDVRWLWWALPALILVAVGVWLGARKQS
jgi:hypothetical protein